MPAPDSGSPSSAWLGSVARRLGVSALLMAVFCVATSGCYRTPPSLDDDSADDGWVDDDSADDDSADDDTSPGDDDTFLGEGIPVTFDVLAWGEGNVTGEPWESMDQDVGCAELNVRLARSEVELDDAIREALPPAHSPNPLDAPVDFSTSSVLVTFLSTCLDEGRVLSVAGISDDGAALRIAEIRLDPCLGLYNVTIRPYNVVAIPSVAGERELLTRLDIETRDCDE